MAQSIGKSVVEILLTLRTYVYVQKSLSLGGFTIHTQPANKYVLTFFPSIGHTRVRESDICHWKCEKKTQTFIDFHLQTVK